LIHTDGAKLWCVHWKTVEEYTLCLLVRAVRVRLQSETMLSRGDHTLNLGMTSFRSFFWIFGLGSLGLARSSSLR